MNALLRRRQSIVQDMPGVTRDRISVPYQLADHYVELVDTGGYGFDDAQGLTTHIRHQIELAMGRADLVVFVVDAHAGLLEEDRVIARLLREQNLKVVLIANKTDGEKYERALGDFARLGLGTPLGVSATTGHNLAKIPQLIEANVDLSNAPREIPEPELHLAVVGKRNAGKSTLVNAIAEAFGESGDRVIVSEVPGTTRDSVDVRFEKDGKTLVVIDTAGVRKKRHMVNDDIEFYSFHRAQRSIRRADVVVMLMDALAAVSEPDKKLAQYVLDQAKPVLLVFNKWDLAREQAIEQVPRNSKFDENELRAKYETYVRGELRGLQFAPIRYVTAKDGRKIQSLIDDARKLHKQATTRVSTAKLNEALRVVLDEKPPSAPGNRRPKVYYVTQAETSPPTIVLFVNNEDYFDNNYQRFMANRFRDLLPFPDVPVRILLKQSHEKAGGSGVKSGGGKAKGGATGERSRAGGAAGGRSRGVQRNADSSRVRPSGRPEVGAIDGFETTKGRGGSRGGSTRSSSKSAANGGSKSSSGSDASTKSTRLSKPKARKSSPKKNSRKQ
jgi:GTP-binding protein